MSSISGSSGKPPTRLEQLVPHEQGLVAGGDAGPARAQVHQRRHHAQHRPRAVDAHVEAPPGERRPAWRAAPARRHHRARWCRRAGTAARRPGRRRRRRSSARPGRAAPAAPGRRARWRSPACRRRCRRPTTTTRAPRWRNGCSACSAPASVRASSSTGTTMQRAGLTRRLPACVVPRQGTVVEPAARVGLITAKYGKTSKSRDANRLCWRTCRISSMQPGHIGSCDGTFSMIGRIG